MKKIFIFAFMFVATCFVSCNKQTQAGDSAADSTSVEVLQEEEIDRMSSLINEVSSCIDSIQIQENLIFNAKEGTTDREKMLIQLRSLKDLLARKQSQINALTAEKDNISASSKKTIQNLQKMVDFISSQLAEKTKQVESLELAVQNKDAKIDELRYGLNELSKESEYLKEQNYQQDREMNRVYYIVASKNELKDLGLLKTKALSKKVLSENIDKNLFKVADKRSLKTIAIDDKNAKVLTNNPESSYTITKNGDGTATLEITDVEKFWAISPYLIIQK